MLTLPLGGVHCTEPGSWRNRAGGIPVSPARSTHALRALHRVALAMAGMVDADGLAAIVAEHTRRLVRAGGVAIYWWDPERGVLDRVADTDARALARPSIGLGSGAAGQAFSSRGPAIVPDYQSWARAVPQVAALGVVSVLAVPIMAKGDPVGVISARSYRPRRWAAPHVELLRVFTGQVAPSLLAARLLAETEQRRAEAEALAELARCGAAETDVDRIMALVAEHACRLLGAEFATATLVEPSGAITRLGTCGSISEAWQTIVTRVSRNSGLTVALRTGKTVVIERIGENPDFPIEGLLVQHAEGLRTSITMPLPGRAGMLGA